MFHLIGGLSHALAARDLDVQVGPAERQVSRELGEPRHLDVLLLAADAGILVVAARRGQPLTSRRLDAVVGYATGGAVLLPRHLSAFRVLRIRAAIRHQLSKSEPPATLNRESHEQEPLVELRCNVGRGVGRLRRRLDFSLERRWQRVGRRGGGDEQRRSRGARRQRQWRRGPERGQRFGRATRRRERRRFGDGR